MLLTHNENCIPNYNKIHPEFYLFGAPLKYFADVFLQLIINKEKHANKRETNKKTKVATNTTDKWGEFN